MDYYHQQAQERGRDAVSQDLETNVLNRGKKPEDMSPEEISVGRNVSDYLKRIGMYGQ